MLMEQWILYPARRTLPSFVQGALVAASPLQGDEEAARWLLCVAIVATVIGDTQDTGEGLAGVGFSCASDEFGRALGDNAAAAFAAFGPEVDDPVGLFDDVEMVLDDEHGVAEINEALQDVEELSNVVEVQAGGGLVENVERAAGLAFRKLTRELDALGFAAGKSGGGLAEGDVAESDFDECGELLLNLGDVFEELQRVGGGQVQNVADGVALVADGERLRVVAAAAADFTHHVNIRKKIHLDAAETVALAGFAAAALHVEAEAPGAVAALARFGEHGKEIADGGEDAGVGGGIRTRRAANGRLIDLDDFVDLISAENFTMGRGRLRRAIELLREGAIENVVDKRGLAGAGDAGDDGEHTERERDVDVFQIVGTRAENLDGFAIGAAAFFGDGNFGGAAEVLAGEGFRGGFDLRRLALGDEVATGVARAGSEVHHKVGAADGVFVVLDDEDGVAEIAKMLKGTEKARVVASVQADAGLVKDVKNAAQARADLRGEANALGFTAGKRGSGTIEAEIAEADGKQEIEAFRDFFEGALGDFFLAGCQLREDFVYRGARGAERERGEISNGPAAKFYGEGFGAETLPMADAAERGGHVLRHPFTIGVRSGFFEIALEEFEDAGKAKAFFGLGFFPSGTLFFRGAAAVRRRVAVEKHVLDARGEFVEGCFEIKAVRVGAEFERAHGFDLETPFDKF